MAISRLLKDLSTIKYPIFTLSEDQNALKRVKGHRTLLLLNREARWRNVMMPRGDVERSHLCVTVNIMLTYSYSSLLCR